MGSRKPYQELDGDAALAVLDALPDIVAVVDVAGTARWVNQRGLDLVGVRPEGYDSLTLWDVLAPTDHKVAALGLLASDSHRPPGQIDILRADGTRMPVEVYARKLEFDGEPCVLLIARRIDYRIEEQIDGLMQGQPFEQVVEKALGQLRHRWPGYLFSLSTVDAGGNPMALGDDLPDLLSPLATTEDGSLPWERAVRDSVEVHVDVEDLDGDMAQAARAFSVDRCGVVPLEDPLGPPACLVTWHGLDHPDQLDRVWLLSAEINLIRLALVRRAAQLALEVAAATDPLTGLSNRTVLFDRLAETVPQPSGRAVLFLDLDGFKAINDTLGHGTGDRLLTLVARRLESVTRGGDLVARIGGDEFAVLASAIDNHEQAMVVAQRIVEVMGAPFEVAPGIMLTVDVSVGVAVDADSSEPADHIVDRADAAMYAAKRSPGSRYYVAADTPP